MLQTNTVRGSRVTVLANATELFDNIDQAMPKFDQWLSDAMGINASSMLQASQLRQLFLPILSTDGQ